MIVMYNRRATEAPAQIRMLANEVAPGVPLYLIPSDPAIANAAR